jgi:hypothetical protein
LASGSGELLHECAGVHDAPVLDHHVVVDAEVFADPDVDGPAGGRDPHELALMSSGHARAHEHLDAFCDQVVGFELRVSECAVKRLEELADARFGGLQARELLSAGPGQSACSSVTWAAIAELIASDARVKAAANESPPVATAIASFGVWWRAEAS